MSDDASTPTAPSLRVLGRTLHPIHTQSQQTSPPHIFKPEKQIHVNLPWCGRSEGKEECQMFLSDGVFSGLTVWS